MAQSIVAPVCRPNWYGERVTVPGLLQVAGAPFALVERFDIEPFYDFSAK